MWRFGRDLTGAARDGVLDPVIGREAEMTRLIQIFLRKTKNNPVLIGRSGVGKTAIVEGLALRIVEGAVPAGLIGKRLVALDLAQMVAGSSFHGEFERRLKEAINLIASSQGEFLLMVDELHMIVGAGGGQGGMDVGNMLKPMLARGELRMIGASTPEEYRQHIEKDAALERRFQPVFVDPPSAADTVDILRGLRERHEAYHGVRIHDSALEAAAHLSDRYVTGRHLPDKAVDLIDEAASRLRIGIDTTPPKLDQANRRARHAADPAACPGRIRGRRGGEGGPAGPAGGGPGRGARRGRRAGRAVAGRAAGHRGHSPGQAGADGQADGGSRGPSTPGTWPGPPTCRTCSSRNWNGGWTRRSRRWTTCPPATRRSSPRSTTRRSPRSSAPGPGCRSSG